MIIYSRNPEICWLFSLRGNKVVYDAHNWPNSRIFLFKYFLKNITLIICNSGGTEVAYKKNGFKNTIKVPNGVDMAKFDIKEEVKDLRHELKLPLNKGIVLYVGHLYKWKGVDVVIKAAEALLGRDDIVFTVVGGTEKDIEKYNDIIKEKKLNNLLLLGHFNHKIIPKFLKAADVLLLPNIPVTDESIKYTSPIKMFEYMASQRPIIASDLPSLREVLNNKNSLFCVPGDHNDLINKIILILSNKKLADALSRRAYDDVKGFTWEVRAKKILDL